MLKNLLLQDALADLTIDEKTRQNIGFQFLRKKRALVQRIEFPQQRIKQENRLLDRHTELNHYTNKRLVFLA